MKENKYDDAVFFEKYSQMPRSQQGLAGAGEWQTLQKLLPDFKNKNVLDLGCGFGWHCFYAAENGAKSVLGIDLSTKMLNIARQKNHFKQITFDQSSMEEAVFSPKSFDVIISSLAFHYIADFENIIKKINCWLVDGGELVFSAEHPVFTAEGSQDWVYDEEGKINHFPVDRYFYEGPREATFLGEKVIKYHRTLTGYLNTLLQNGFEILNIEEPMPPESMLTIDGMADELRRPMMLIVKAQKK